MIIRRAPPTARLDSEHYAQFVAAVEGIRQSLATWPHQGSAHRLHKVRGLYKLNPLAIVRRALATCPDDYPPAELAGRSLSTMQSYAKTSGATSRQLLWALEKREVGEIETAMRNAKDGGWLGNVPKGALVV